MGGGHQGPLPVHLLQAPQPEAIQPSGALDLTEHRFHDRLAQGIDRLTRHRAQFSLHPTSGIQTPGRRTPGWPGPLAVLLPTGGDVGRPSPLLAGFQIGGAAIAGVGDQGRAA